jgi:tetratricopeptide (TPR) repeat protein
VAKAAWFGIVCVSAMLAMGRPTPAWAQQDDDAETQARTYFVTGDYKQALDIYTHLYLKTPHPTYLRNIGRCYQNMGEPDKALSAFHEYLRKAEDLDPKRRAEVEGFIKEMEDLKRQRAVAPAPAPLPTAPLPMSASAHEPTVSLSATPERAEAEGNGAVYTRWWFWTAIGVAVVGGVATALLLPSSPGDPKTDFGVMNAQPHL